MSKGDMIHCQSLIPDIPQPPQAPFVSTTHAFTGVRDVFGKLIFQIESLMHI